MTAPEVRIRLPRQNYIGFVGLAVTTVPLAFASPWLALLWLIPVAGIVQVRRTGVDADAAGLTVLTVRGSRTLSWDDLRGLRIRRNKTWAVLMDGEQVRLPVVRPRHLSVLAEASGGRLPDPAQ